MLKDNCVYVMRTDTWEYPFSPPFNPSENYPEYQFDGELCSRNTVYGSVRKLLFEMGMDKENFGAASWNPFGDFIVPGNTVLIKPNMVLHRNQLDKYSVESVVTHGSFIRVILDYVHIALKGTGNIIIADAPIQSCDFDSLVRENGIVQILELYQSYRIPIELVDFRKEKAIVNRKGQVIGTQELSGDPRGYTVVDLGNSSTLEEVSHKFQNFRVTNYSSKTMKEHHNRETHEYLIPNTVLDSDVVINLPKPKTHRKVGITGAMKNLVGINGSKDWLPHHRVGSVLEGGDEYHFPDVFKKINSNLQERIDECSLQGRRTSTIVLRRAQVLNGVLRKLAAKDKYLEGSWWGNDTIWRTVCDLNRLLVYANKDGLMTSEIQRKNISFLDMIVSGEGEGPLRPTPKFSGVIVAGHNPLIVDTVVSRLMGFDHGKIPCIDGAYRIERFPITSLTPADIRIHSNCLAWDGSIDNITYENSLKYVASSGWKGYIELAQNQ